MIEVRLGVSCSATKGVNEHYVVCSLRCVHVLALLLFQIPLISMN